MLRILCQRQQIKGYFPTSLFFRYLSTFYLVFSPTQVQMSHPAGVDWTLCGDYKYKYKYKIKTYNAPYVTRVIRMRGKAQLRFIQLWFDGRSTAIRLFSKGS